MGQTAITAINPDSGTTLYIYEAGLAQSNDVGNYTVTTDAIGDLPAGASSVSPETGNIFTDIFSSIKGWIASTTGLKYVIGIVNAVPNFLKVLGLPSEFTFIIGSIWHTLTVLLLALLMWGKD